MLEEASWVLEEEVTAGWGLMCSLIVVLVYVVNVEECMKELILIVIVLVIMILFFVISIMNVCINSYIKFTRLSDRIDFVKLLLLLLLNKGVNNYCNDNVQLTDNQTDLQLRPPT